MSLESPSYTCHSELGRGPDEEPAFSRHQANDVDSVVLLVRLELADSVQYHRVFGKQHSVQKPRVILGAFAFAFVAPASENGN
jgi:hypothetical protein